MKAYSRLKSFRLAAIVLAASFLFVSTSCDKGPNENSPELPPVESLMMSFSDFDAPRGDTKASGEPHLNFNYAFTSLVFWSGASAITMALPVAAYGSVLEQDPVSLGDASLLYTYVEPALLETGSYISYEYAPLEVYDASFTVSRSTGTTLVQWNTLQGRTCSG